MEKHILGSQQRVSKKKERKNSSYVHYDIRYAQLSLDSGRQFRLDPERSLIKTLLVHHEGLVQEVLSDLEEKPSRELQTKQS